MAALSWVCWSWAWIFSRLSFWPSCRFSSSPRCDSCFLLEHETRDGTEDVQTDAHLGGDEVEALGDVGLGFLEVLLDEDGADELEDGVVGGEEPQLLAHHLVLRQLGLQLLPLTYALLLLCKTTSLPSPAQPI